MPHDSSSSTKPVASARDEIALATAMLLGFEPEFLYSDGSVDNGEIRAGVRRSHWCRGKGEDSREWRHNQFSAAWMYLLHRGLGISSEPPFHAVPLDTMGRSHGLT
jgi:hypothetical protein